MAQTLDTLGRRGCYLGPTITSTIAPERSWSKAQSEVQREALSVACLVADAEKMLAMSGDPVTVDGIARLVQRWRSTTPRGEELAERTR